jgi:hypothetical protein
MALDGTIHLIILKIIANEPSSDNKYTLVLYIKADLLTVQRILVKKHEGMVHQNRNYFVSVCKGAEISQLV